MNGYLSKKKSLALNLCVAIVAYVVSIVLGYFIVIPFDGYSGNAI